MHFSVCCFRFSNSDLRVRSYFHWRYHLFNWRLVNRYSVGSLFLDMVRWHRSGQSPRPILVLCQNLILGLGQTAKPSWHGSRRPKSAIEKICPPIFTFDKALGFVGPRSWARQSSGVQAIHPKSGDTGYFETERLIAKIPRQCLTTSSGHDRLHGF